MTSMECAGEYAKALMKVVRGWGAPTTLVEEKTGGLGEASFEIRTDEMVYDVTVRARRRVA